MAVTKQDLLRDMKRGVFINPNVDGMVKIATDPVFYDIARRAEWLVCDSKILYLTAKLIGRPLPEAIPGSSFFPAFYEYHKNDPNCKIFLLGAMDGVAKQAMDNINSKIGRQIVVGAHSPSFGFEKKADENTEIVRMINESGANVVLVGVGCPKQEKWIDIHKAEMPGVDLWMPLGATIDFEAGNVKRAPKIFQMLYIEWLYRLMKEPKRMFKRYFKDDMVFFWLVFKQVLGIYKSPFEQTKESQSHATPC